MADSQRSRLPRRDRRLWSVVALAGALGATGQASAAPILWGVGVSSCADFLAVAPADLLTPAIAGEGYRRYQEWLAGLVTGLNLATGGDVLKGAELDAALLKIRANCERYPNDDFFNASLRLLRGLGELGEG
jgi:hypothetical protein